MPTARAPLPGGGWRRWGFWGDGQEVPPEIYSSTRLSGPSSARPERPPPCLAALRVGVVCPLLTHAISEPTASFILPSPPLPLSAPAQAHSFLAAHGPVPPCPFSSAPQASPLDTLSPPKRRSLAPPSGPSPAPSGFKASRMQSRPRTPHSWPQSTSFPVSPALGC